MVPRDATVRETDAVGGVTVKHRTRFDVERYAL
jgi:hypothetical protein